MPSLEERLRALGVKTGTAGIAPHKAGRDRSLESALGGHWMPTHRGDAFAVEQTFSIDYRHGAVPIRVDASLGTLSAWAADERVNGMPISSFAFLDTETSGLAGGTGTYAFMVGVGRFEAAPQTRPGSSRSQGKKKRSADAAGGVFHLVQFFMPDPAEEAALLEALAGFLAPCAALVTFNGKAFDAPILRTRYVLNSIPVPFGEFAHVDLLPLARRLWRDRLPSRALKYLEENVLSAPRTSEEVPGYEIPWLYFDYLKSGDATPLSGVFYHNAMDIVAMAALFSHMAQMLADPHGSDLEHGLDVVALAKLFEDLSQPDDAALLYERGLKIGLPEEGFAQAVRRLSALQRRRGDLDAAVRLWEQAAAQGHIYAHVELAKYYEHRRRDYGAALHWTKAALVHLDEAEIPAYERAHWRKELQHRLKRLEGKADKG
jgi:uncharacterized protein YprB with RNaseH-like and TPR domain